MLSSLHPRRWRLELIGLIAAAFVTRLWAITTPKDVVFDEIYFKVFSGHYFDGHYFFDIHPPLGKLLLAGTAWLLHIPTASLLDGPAPALRLLPALAGALIIPVFWLLLRRLGASYRFAFLGAVALLLDNALTVESRFVLMDSMLLLFGLGALTAYLTAREAKAGPRWIWLAAAGVLAGATASIKWTGLTALALIGFLWLADQGNWRAHWRRRLGELAVLVLVPLAVYVSAFAIHFALLPKSGDGDAFMSLRFQQTLQDGTQYNPATRLSFWDKFSELNVEMYRANQTLTATHPYGSRWYTWPLELRPIYYWAGPIDDHNRQGNIYLLGNPVVWWDVPVALIIGLLEARRRRRRLSARTRTALALAGGAYLMNFVPFMGVPRVMFLYHYFFSFVFSLVFVVLLWNELGLAKRTYWWVLGAIALGFLFFAPLTYGWPLSPAGLQLHMWLPSWR